jgi:non-specific serine/threonine protein kinase
MQVESIMDRSGQVMPTESLPRPLTSLIGREREVVEVADLLRRPEVQLVTLTGPGGVGKTRLAITVASNVVDAFPDGVCFVDLSPLQEPGIVIPIVAQAIGLRGQPDSLQSLLMTLMQGQRRLLLLDNFEQVIAAAPHISGLLMGAPSLTVMVTSREPLRVSGEREYPVGPLSLPVDATAFSQDELSQLDAVRLFTDRARAVLPSFALTSENAGAVIEICRRLDGLPLAIELAAARVKALPPAALLARLGQRLPVLTGSRRDVPERQQTMRGAIAWSHDLLTLPEQTLFRRLAVFVGGFSLEGAEAVVTSPEEPGIDVFAGIASLIDKSLIRPDPSATAEPRYVMLETIREFAHEQFMASGEANAVCAAHVAWCIALAEEWRIYGDTRHLPEMAGRVEPPLTTEYDNVRAALAWLEEIGDRAALARLAGAMWWFWLAHGTRADGIHWLQLGSAVEGDTSYNKLSRLWIIQGVASLSLNSGKYDDALVAVHESLALSRELGEHVAEATAMAMIGYCAICIGDYDSAIDPLQESIQINQRIGHWRAAATVNSMNGLSAYGMGRFDEAAAILEETSAVLRESGDSFDLAVALNTLALVRCGQGNHAEAAALLTESLPIWRDLTNHENVAEWLADVATVATATDEAELAIRLLGSAYALRDRVGYAFSYPERATYERVEQRLRERSSPETFDRAWRLGSVTALERVLAEATAYLDQLRQPAAPSHPAQPESLFGLTPRERDVLRLLTQGKSDKEIADTLFIGLRTVETHVSNLLGKLGAHNRAEATALAVRNDLV